jgi:pimeloyl-ACP methyl ester carboxylesterase
MVLKLKEKNVAEGTDARLTFCGHSLGGGLATAAALATGGEAFAFDAAGLSDATIESLGLDTNNASKVSNFNVRECFVSDWNGKADDTTLGSIKRLGLFQRQHGNIYWLKSISDRADFKGLPDDWPIVKKAETLLAHAWHVFTYQLEHRNFDETTWSVSDENTTRPSKRAMLASPVT